MRHGFLWSSDPLCRSLACPLHWIPSPERTAVPLAANGTDLRLEEPLACTRNPTVRNHFLRRFASTENATGRLVDLIRQSPDSYIRHAALLALGESKRPGVMIRAEHPLVAMLQELYSNDKSAAVHSAVEWVLRRWGFQQQHR